MRTGRHGWRWGVAIWVACGAWALAGELISRLPVDDVVYENVRWGPVKDGKVTVFHSKGIATVPLAKLPPAYQAQFGYHPPPEAAGAAPADPFSPEPPSPPPPLPAAADGKVDSTYERIQLARANTQHAAALAEYDHYLETCSRLASYKGQVVEKAKLTTVIGLVRGKGTIEEDKVVTAGLLVELAKPKENIEKIPASMRLRPGLWQGTGTQVFLREYTTNLEAGRPVRVWGEEGDQVGGYRTFFLARELTIEQWRQLPPPAKPAAP